MISFQPRFGNMFQFKIDSSAQPRSDSNDLQALYARHFETFKRTALTEILSSREADTLQKLAIAVGDTNVYALTNEDADLFEEEKKDLVEQVVEEEVEGLEKLQEGLSMVSRCFSRLNLDEGVEILTAIVNDRLKKLLPKLVDDFVKRRQDVHGEPAPKILSVSLEKMN